jgi:hypothetical protein
MNATLCDFLTCSIMIFWSNQLVETIYRKNNQQQVPEGSATGVALNDWTNRYCCVVDFPKEEIGASERKPLTNNYQVADRELASIPLLLHLFFIALFSFRENYFTSHVRPRHHIYSHVPTSVWDKDVGMLTSWNLNPNCQQSSGNALLASLVI